LGESVERLTVRCDVWRSKYLAAKALADEMQAWKHCLALVVGESQALVRALLVRNEINVRRMERAHDELMRRPHDLDLQRIAGELRRSLVGRMKGVEAERLGESELLARQMLQRFQWLPFAPAEIKSVDEMEMLIERLKESRREMIERDDGLMELGAFYGNCCKQCKGPLRIV
jgi:hypothetical protein